MGLFMLVILIIVDYNSFNLDFSEVHVYIFLLKIFIIVGAVFGISYYVTPFNIDL